METVFLTLSNVVVVFYLFFHAFSIFLLLASIDSALAQPRRARMLVPEELFNPIITPPVTMLVPAHNEEAPIVESVRALLSLRYPYLEVIVINDGSTDSTLQELIASFSMRRADLVYEPRIPTEPVRGIYLSTTEPRLMVIDKVNGGKSDSLNAGLNLCDTPWVCSVDADSILEEDAVMRAMRPIVEDSTVVASSGIVRIANGCRVAGGRVVRVGLPSGKLAMYQVVEYLHGFLQGRLGWSWLGGLLIISGAFGVFRTDVLRAVGGYSRATVAEDMEIVIRIHRYFRERREPYQVIFVPDPVCWTEVPSRVSALRRQRRRWQRGLAEVLTMHRDLLFRPSMGLVGFLPMPFFLLELLTPIAEVSGLTLVPLAWKLGWLSDRYLQVYLVLAFVLGTTFAIWAVIVEEFTYRRYVSWRDLVRLLLFALTENLGYHQVILWFRLEGLYDYVRGRREWGEQVRAGFRHRDSSKV